MNVDRKEIIGGQPAKIARDVVIWIGGGSRTPSRIAERFKLCRCHTDKLVAAMVKQGLLERHPPNERSHGEHIYRLGEVALRFANAKFIRRLERAKAEVVLTDLLRRVAEINDNPELCCFVRELRLFGSMLDPEAATVGDIDVGYDLGQRKTPPQYTGDYPYGAWNIARAEASGRSIGSYIDLISYGEIEVKRLLQARNRYLSLHTIGDLVRIGEKCQRIYAATKETVANIDPEDSLPKEVTR